MANTNWGAYWPEDAAYTGKWQDKTKVTKNGATTEVETVDTKCRKAISDVSARFVPVAVTILATDFTAAGTKPYTVTGMKADMDAIATINGAGLTAAQYEEVLKNIAKISGIATTDGGISVTAVDALTSDIPLYIKAVK